MESCQIITFRYQTLRILICFARKKFVLWNIVLSNILILTFLPLSHTAERYKVHSTVISLVGGLQLWISIATIPTEENAIGTVTAEGLMVCIWVRIQPPLPLVPRRSLRNTRYYLLLLIIGSVWSRVSQILVIATNSKSLVLSNLCKSCILLLIDAAMSSHCKPSQPLARPVRLLFRNPSLTTRSSRPWSRQNQ